MKNQNRNFAIISLVIFAVCISGALLPGLQAQKFELITPPILELGDVPSDSIATGTIQFKNSGEQPMTIEQVKTSCGCAAAEMEKLVYNPGETGEIRVDFNTKGYSGLTRKTVTVTLKEGAPKSIRIIIQTRVVPKIEVEPRFVDYQRIELSEEPVERSFLVRNNMKKKLVVTDLDLNSSFVKVSPKQFTLQPGETQQVSVIYQPHKVGRDDSLIIFKIENPPQLQHRVPIFVNVMPAQE